MKRKHVGFGFVYSLLVVSMLIAIAIPPWNYTEGRVTRSAGYAPLFLPPDFGAQYASLRIFVDFQRLGLELAIPIVIIGALALYRARSRAAEWSNMRGTPSKEFERNKVGNTTVGVGKHQIEPEPIQADDERKAFKPLR